MSTWEKSFALPQGKRVVLDQGSGNVTVKGWEQTTVSVKASTRYEANIDEMLKVEERSDGLYLAIRSISSGLLFWQSRPQVDLELLVPFHTALKLDSGAGPVLVEDTRAKVDIDLGSGSVEASRVGALHVNTGSGSVKLQDIDGSVRLESGSGSAEVTQVHGPVHIAVGSGNVTVTKVVGNLYAETGSGRVLLNEVVGSVKAESGSGGLELAKVQGDEVSFETGSGAIVLEEVAAKRLTVQTGAGRIQAKLQTIHDGGDYRLETQAGDIVVTVPAGAGLKVNLESPLGPIRYDGVPLQVTHQARGEVAGTVNGGGATFYAYAQNGIALTQASAEPASPVEALVHAIKQDAALENNEAMRRVLKMVEEGKLSTEEADEILRTLEDEEAVQA